MTKEGEANPQEEEQEERDPRTGAAETHPREEEETEEMEETPTKEQEVETPAHPGSVSIATKCVITSHEIAQSQRKKKEDPLLIPEAEKHQEKETEAPPKEARATEQT